MPTPLAYFNGRLVSEHEISVPVWDTGFIQGVTVAEQMRTFKGKLFRLPQHIQRLGHSLEIVGIDLGAEFGKLAEIAEDLAARNHAMLAPGDDLVLSLFVTPGPYPTVAESPEPRPTIGMHTRPLPFHLWAGKYETGQRLMVSDVRQVPTSCWPVELKCRSRMHYYLADRQAQSLDPGARALLLDQQGRVMESSTANVVLYRRAEGLVLPQAEHILPGVSMGVLLELADRLGITCVHRDLSVDDVTSADEVLLCSTSPCLLPVVAVNRQPIGDGTPGPVFQRALLQWSQFAGLDIRSQAHRFARRGEA